MTEAARGLKQKPAPEDDPNVWSEYEIEAHTSLVDRPLRTLKHGDAFAVLDSSGDIGTEKDTPEGLYYRDTRFLSQFELRIDGKRPLLLSSVALEDKSALAVDLTNPDIPLSEEEKLPRDTVFIERTKFLWQAVCYERIKIKNYSSSPHRFRIDLLYAADYCDLFEVRGTSRRRRGRDAPAVVGKESVGLRYDGLDGISRRTILHFAPPPERIDSSRTTWYIELEPYGQTSLFVSVAFEAGEAVKLSNFFAGYRDARRARRASTADIATITSSNEHFDDVASRATSDVYTLATRTELGVYPYAGIPWFSTVFGRDGIITAMLMLWIDPQIAKGVLRTLAATQATERNIAADSEPGKILHETRAGEMANLGEVPFRRYYGSVDSTPLFLMLAGLYFDRTGDRATIEAIWPNIEAALNWIDTFGDQDDDGFVEYYRETDKGLANQGWKDSHDAIFHADGSTAAGRIALCEVQGYVYAAKRAVSRIASALGNHALENRLLDESRRLQEKFEAAFWCPELDTYALALDGAKNKCCVRASNAGHALFTGIADPERARLVAATLMSPEGFSGWGIRTVAHGEARYNPMSYHNGSVWPHDNALIALGLARYGLKAAAGRVLEGLFNAAAEQEMRRLPELFCGFNRRPHRGPTAYPVACVPQAWAAASIFGLLAGCLGLELAHSDNQLCFRDPVLPDFLDHLTIRNLGLGDSRLDLRLNRYGRDVTVNVISRTGSARVMVLK